MPFSAITSNALSGFFVACNGCQCRPREEMICNLHIDTVAQYLEERGELGGRIWAKTQVKGKLSFSSPKRAADGGESFTDCKPD